MGPDGAVPLRDGAAVVDGSDGSLEGPDAGQCERFGGDRRCGPYCGEPCSPGERYPGEVRCFGSDGVELRRPTAIPEAGAARDDAAARHAPGPDWPGAAPRHAPPGRPPTRPRHAAIPSNARAAPPTAVVRLQHGGALGELGAGTNARAFAYRAFTSRVGAQASAPTTRGGARPEGAARAGSDPSSGSRPAPRSTSGAIRSDAGGEPRSRPGSVGVARGSPGGAGPRECPRRSRSAHGNPA